MISAFLVDFNDHGVEVASGYKNVSHRGYTNNILRFDNARIPRRRIMGPDGDGFRIVNQWLGPTRLTVAATCVARAERAFEIALNYSATREQFGQKIAHQLENQASPPFEVLFRQNFSFFEENKLQYFWNLLAELPAVDNKFEYFRQRKFEKHILKGVVVDVNIKSKLSNEVWYSGYAPYLDLITDATGKSIPGLQY